MLKTLMIGCWLLGAGVPISEPQDIGLWAQWGLAGVVVAFVMWRDTTRERQMREKAEADQKFMQDTLLGVIRENTLALSNMQGTVKKCQVSSKGQVSFSTKPEEGQS